MKHSFKNLFYYVIAATMLLSSCDKDEVETPAPSLNIVNASSIAKEVNKSEEVSFPLEVSALEKIEKIDIMEYIDGSGNNVTGYPKTSGFKSNTEDNFTYKYVINADGGTIKLVFSVTDKKGKTSSKEHTFTVKPAATPLAFTKDGGIIANKIGPDQSAWDLVTNARKAKNTPESDMQNPTTVGWVKGWDGVRNTTFVKSTTEVYETATVESATAAFAAGTALSSVTNVAVGDVYIAKIKGGSHYAVLKITHADNDIEINNAEKIEFTYKKQAENSGQ